tara:strand:+ start:6857 stop:9757 length:2901 start_codon:yes stop_codon:yes gene_type:complete
MVQLFVAAAGAILGTAAGTIGATAILGTTVATIAGYAAYTAVTAYAINALQKKALNKAKSAAASVAAAQKGYGTNVNAVAPASDHAIIYGQQRVGGVIFYRSITNDQLYLHTLIALAGHECEEIGTIYADNVALTLDGNNFVTNDQFQIKDADGNIVNSALRINKHLGSSTQSADADLVAEDSAWTSSHQARGVAYIYIRAEFDTSIFPQGLPTFSAIVKGKKVFDPRTSTTAWSSNAALCLRDYLISDYGLGAESTEINDTVFSTAANTCDENVTLSAGGTEKRYTVDGSFVTSLPPDDIITDLVASMAGTIYYSQGQWGVKAGEFTSSVLTLDEDDLRSNLQVNTRHSRRDNFNTVSGMFSGPDTEYQPTDFPQITSSTFVSVDGGETVVQDIPLPFTSTASRAQRIAKIALYRNREQLTISGTFGLRALQLQIGDIVSITNTRLGFSSKTFEVADWRFGFGTDQTLEVHLTLREISSPVFDWSAEETTFELNSTVLPAATEVPTVGLGVDFDLRIVNQAAVGVLIIDVTANEPYAVEFEAQYKRSSDTRYVSVGKQKNGLFEVTGLGDDQYDVRARAFNAFGVAGPFTATAGKQLTAFASPPDNVTNFTGNVTGNALNLSWTPVSNADLSHYKVRYSSETSGASYQNAVDIVDKISRPGNTAVVPAKTGTYFLKAVDKIGGVSATAASFVVLVDPNNVENFNAIQTIQEDPVFSGVRTDVVVLEDSEGDYLALDTIEDFDSQTGNFDDALGLFDGFSGTVASGIYYWNNSVDFGEVYTSRIYPKFKVDYLDYVNDFDSATGNFDDRLGDFDGDPAQFDVTSASFELRHTNDDPSGTPSWSNWQPFIVADITARAMEFRVQMTCSNAAASPAIRELRAEIDMPERTQSEVDITFTGTKSVTFPTKFKGVPALGISLANLADGERYVITNKTRAGFDIEIFDGVTQSTNSVTLDYVAKGFGKEIV